MKAKKSEVQADIKKFKALDSLKNLEGGKILIKALKKDIRNDIDIILSLVAGDEIKLRTAVMSLNKSLAIYKTITNAKNLLDIAMEALDYADENE